MTHLGRRMDALEARAFAAEIGMPIDELLAEIEDKAVLVNRLLAEGRGIEEIMERCAAHWNIPLDALRRNCEARARRRGVDLALAETPPRFTRPAPRRHP